MIFHISEKTALRADSGKKLLFLNIHAYHPSSLSSVQFQLKASNFLGWRSDKRDPHGVHTHSSVSLALAKAGKHA